MRLALLAVVCTALVCEPALAADSLKQSGDPVIDERPVVDDAHWTISETSATWDTQSFTGKYTWSIPSSIPAGGAGASLTVTSTDKSGGRYTGVISLTGDIPVEGGPAQAQAAADKNGGQATASDTASFRLVPGSYCDTCTPSVTVHVQDGPKITFQYRVAAPPCSVAARFSQQPGDPNCKLGKLPVGKQVTVDQPEPGKTKNISPQAIPPETYKLILEILAEQEHERLIAALAAKLGGEEGARDALKGCILMHSRPFESYDMDTDDIYLTFGSAAALFKACARVLLSGSPPAPASARPAARRCHVTVVPLFKKGTKVTKRRRRQAVAAIKRRVEASCKARPKGMALSLKARGKGATLNRVTGKRIGAPLARLSNTPANGRRASVRWRALKR